MAPLPHKLVSFTVFALIAVAFLVMALYFPVAYIWATYEDLVGEWAQTYSFLAAAVLSLVVAMRPSQYRWFFALLTLACSYVFFEEISWGQRIIGFDTPDFLASRNLQGEANIHNLFTGPHKTFLKDAISLGLAVALFAYGVLYPLLKRQHWSLALWADKMGIAAPPLALWPFFLIAAFFELKPLSFNEAEIAELLIALALSLTALQYLYAESRQLSVNSQTWDRVHSLQLGQQMIVLSVFLLLLASVTTVTFYSDPENKARVDRRINNGVEKFARRYERYNRCDIATGLYDRLLSIEPERVFILRKQAACFRDLGDTTRFDELAARAIAIDRRKYSEDPARASVNRSLVRSYRLTGNEAMAQKHLDEALRIGIDRVTRHPDSANAAYSYGRTLQLAGRQEEAFAELERAYDMDRTSSRFRKAYFAARARLDD